LVYTEISFIFVPQLKNKVMCEKSGAFGKDRNGKQYDCGSMYNCCDCGNVEDGCGCSYCFSCNACEECLNDDEEEKN
jgi:hypothetical protein